MINHQDEQLFRKIKKYQSSAGLHSNRMWSMPRGHDEVSTETEGSVWDSVLMAKNKIFRLVSSTKA